MSTDVQDIKSKTIVYPLTIVLAVISLIELIITGLYPFLHETWEKIPVLTIILLVPLSVISAFLYLWLVRPAHIFSPAEFGIGEMPNSN